MGQYGGLTRRQPHRFVERSRLGLLNVFWYVPPVGSDAIRDDGFIGRVVGAGQIFAFYIYKAMVPFNLSFVYPRWNINSESPIAWIPTVLLVLSLTYFLSQRKWRSAEITLLILFMLISLFPVLGFFDIYFMKYSWVADHYLYLTLPGIIAVFVTFFSRITKSTRQRVILGSLVAIAYATQSAVRAADYSDQKAMWIDTLNKNPSAWMAQDNLGQLLLDEGKIDESIDHFNAALRIKPDNVEAQLNLGSALLKKGKKEEATAWILSAVKLQPRLAEAHISLGIALLAQGKAEEGIEQYREALTMKPNLWKAHFNLGSALADQGKTQEALEHYAESLRMNPGLMEAHAAIGKCLLALGRGEEAIEQFAFVVKAKSSDAEALYNLGTALISVGKPEMAIIYLDDSLKIQPDYITARLNLGNALLSLGRNQEAIEQYDQVIRRKPDSADAFNNIGTALFKDHIQDAIQSFNEALRIKPDYADAHKNLAVAYIMAGNKNYARREYNILERLNPAMANQIKPLLNRKRL